MLFNLKNRHLKADIWLLFLTVIWGTSFPLVKIALQYISPSLFLAIRFWLGGLFLLPFIWSRKHLINKHRINRSFILGCSMFLGMMLQTLGLKFTTASKSGFLTGLAVIFVPILVIFFENKFPKKTSVFGAILALIGIFFLTNPQTGGLNKGDLLTLLGAICFAFQILFIEMFVKNEDTLIMAFLMILFTAFFATISSFLFDTIFIRLTPGMLFPLFWVALFSTSLGFWIQVKWQPYTSATAAAVIFSMEPVFAFLFAAILIGERLSAIGMLGGGLIFCGILISELRE